MSLAPDNYGRRTLEFVSRISALTDAGEVRKLTVEELAWYGFDYVTCWSLPSIDEEVSDTFALNTRPKCYLDHYNATRLVAKDPVVTTMRETMATHAWSDVRTRRRLSKAECSIIDEGRDFGATDGLTVPVHSADGWLGVFSPCGFKPDLSPRARSALEIVGIYAHQALQRLSSRRTKSNRTQVPLTPREREVMRWVALGKTNDEIGTILRIQRTTVKTILSRAQEKLSANSRTYAVVQALRTGELDMNF